MPKTKIPRKLRRRQPLSNERKPNATKINEAASDPFHPSKVWAKELMHNQKSAYLLLLIMMQTKLDLDNVKYPAIHTYSNRARMINELREEFREFQKTHPHDNKKHA